MKSPLALVLDEDPSVRERALGDLARAGIEAVAVATPREALEVLRKHPFAVVLASFGDAPARARRSVLEDLCRLRAEDGRRADGERILGRSEASEALRRRVQDLAVSRVPVLLVGEAGSGRRHAARCLHALSSEPGSFVVVPSGGGPGLDAALAQGRGTVFVPSLEQLPWPAQESLAAALAATTILPRVVASSSVDPHLAAEEGRLSRTLVAAFEGSIVRVPPLRERPSDVALLVRTFIEELRLLNGLPPLAVDPDALSALERYGWPGNVLQLRGAVESALILATGGTLRAKDLPEHVTGAARLSSAEARADRRFREAKRSVVDAFERAYLQDLLERHGGNVTGAAEQAGMLRSALQRLLRRHELHSADFRRGGGPGPYAS
jgi:DNA-binding NtrC family response regulator